MKRVIALLLVICTLAVMLLACGKKKEESKTTQKPTETEAPTNMWGESDLGVDVEGKWADVSFDGDTLTFLVLNDDKVSREWETEDAGSDELDQQIELRNEIVEGNLDLDVNIQLTTTCAPGGEWGLWTETFPKLIQQDVDNKLHDIDGVANYGVCGMTVTLMEYYENLLDKDTFPYFDFSLACWNQAIVENGTLNGRLYLIAGDMNLSLFNTSMIMWHNMDLYDKIEKEEGDPEDIQDIVLGTNGDGSNGTWTYDVLYKWAGYWVDDGDDATCNDIYGVAIQNGPQPNDAIIYAWDIGLFTKESDGTYSFNVVGNQKAEDAMTDFRRLFYRDGNQSNGTHPHCVCGGPFRHFIQGGTLFMAETLYFNRDTSAALREMTDAYTILPWPKYTTDQDNYYTTSQDYLTMVSILDHSGCATPTKGEAVSAYLQYSNEYSYDNVRGYYFHKIVKAKMLGTSDDSEGKATKSWKIFELIVNNLQFDFGYIYNGMFDNIISTIWRTNAFTDPTTVQLKYEQNEDFYLSRLDTLHAFFGLVEAEAE